MTTFVLVSGAWHAGWCWERIVPMLEAEGHRAIAPDLLGTGSDRATLSTVTLAQWADQIAAVIRDQDETVVLVGHSRGGIVISEVAERVPRRISALVYLTAMLVPSGETMAGMSAKVTRKLGISDVLNVQEDGSCTVHIKAIEPIFYNTTEAKWVARARNALTSEPMIVFTTPLNLTDPGFGSVRRIYIECTQDQAIPLELQKLMQKGLPCGEVFTLETDHSPFYSAPDKLVTCLLQI